MNRLITKMPTGVPLPEFGQLLEEGPGRSGSRRDVMKGVWYLYRVHGLDIQPRPLSPGIGVGLVIDSYGGATSSRCRVRAVSCWAKGRANQGLSSLTSPSLRRCELSREKLRRKSAARKAFLLVSREPGQVQKPTKQTEWSFMNA